MLCCRATRATAHCSGHRHREPHHCGNRTDDWVLHQSASACTQILSGDPNFTSWSCGSARVALGAYAHQDIPFDKLVEDLQPERSLSHNPIVQALFVMQNIPPQQRELPGLELLHFPLITRSKFDVAVFMRENNGGTSRIGCTARNCSIVARYCAWLQILKRYCVMRSPARRSELSELQIQSDEEKQRTRNREKPA